MINQPSHISLNNTSRKHVGYVFACYFDNFKFMYQSRIEAVLPVFLPINPSAVAYA